MILFVPSSTSYQIESINKNVIGIEPDSRLTVVGQIKFFLYYKFIGEVVPTGTIVYVKEGNDTSVICVSWFERGL